MTQLPSTYPYLHRTVDLSTLRGHVARLLTRVRTGLRRERTHPSIAADASPHLVRLTRGGFEPEVMRQRALGRAAMAMG